MLLLLPVAFAAPLVTAPRAPMPTLITDVGVFDSERAVVVGPVNVLLRDGRIEAIWADDTGLSTMVRSLPDLDVVNGRGRTLLPGLIDAHTHAWGGFAVPGRLRLPDPVGNLKAFAYCGVTTIVDLSEDTDVVARMNDRIARGAVVGPRIYGSGRPFTAPGGHPVSSVRAMYPGALVRWATRHLAWGVVTGTDVDRGIAAEGDRVAVKVILDAIPDEPGSPQLSAAALARLRLASDALGLPMLAHVGRPADVDAALAASVDGLAHAPWKGRLREDQIAALRDKFVIPTLVVWQATEEIAHQDVAIEDLEAEVLDRFDWIGLNLAAAGRAPFPAAMADWASSVVLAHDDRVENVRRLHEAGVALRVGSDGPLLGLAAGAGTHQELDLLREAGLSPAEALQAATWTNRVAIGPDPKIGAVRPGFEADLLLVDGDPTADLGNLHRIVDVWLDGRRLVRIPRRTP
jgi:imidazolonepropionase-like amidohydrolase